MKMTMDNVTSEMLLEVIKVNNLADVPSVITVLDFNLGEYQARNDEMKPWANLVVTDTRKLEALKTIDLEENAKMIKVKLAKYEGENLDNLLGKELSTQNMNLEFSTDKFGNVTGLVFKTSLDELELAK
ncbi:hypothetical protein ETI03_11245 [Macrococcoides canis]|uniref:hypothetical protein n=1 Tax=Macrococcoides canis TaxID=1855823 RepID=UPI0010617FF7|nr:hypothetical protein [Macrococcus canis]TDM28962.1 hypothetical protein ETI03_11245 [Macrococcus canis]